MKKFSDKNLGRMQTDFKSVREEWNFRTARQPHPFFGMRQAPNFETVENFEGKKRENEFVVGLFGGSVANHLFRYIEKNRDTTETLVNIQGRPIRIINFARGSLKQPSQLNIAIQYSQAIDAAINIEGNNEIVYNLPEDAPIYSPSKSVFNAYYSGFKNLAQFMKYYGWEEKRMMLYSKITSFHRLSSLRVFYMFRAFRLVKKINHYESYQKKINSQSLSPWKEYNNKVENKVSYWHRMSCVQQNILRDFSIPSFFYFQPLPILPGRKILTSAEEAMVNEHRDEKAKIKFNQATQNMMDLSKKSGLNLIDGTYIFKKERGEIYIDGCCHLNERGNKILWENIVKEMKSRFENPKMTKCDLSRGKD